MSDEGTIKKTAEPVYYVENTVRRVGTRLHRARSATRHRFKIFLGERRILRNKMLPLTGEQMGLYEGRIRELMLAGKVAVHTPDGDRIYALPDGSVVCRRADGVLVTERSLEDGAAKEAPAERAPVEEAPSEEVPVAGTPVEEEEEVEGDDDLTNLPSIGASRAKKLDSAGLGTFAAISKAAPATIVKILGITEEVAKAVVAAAKK